MTTVKNTFTSLDLRVSKSRWAKNNIFAKEKHMKPKWQVLNKLVPDSPFTGQNVRLSSRPLSKNLPEDD